MSCSNCNFLTCIQVSQAGKVVWYSRLLKNFPQFVVIHSVKGFCIVSEDEVDAFLEFPCFLHDPTNVDNLISGSSAFSKPSLYIWKFSVHMVLKPSLKDFEHNLVSMWNECNCAVVWHSLALPFFGIWRRKWQPTPVLLPGKFCGWRSLVGYSPWGRKESNMTEQPHFHFSGNFATVKIRNT